MNDRRLVDTNLIVSHLLKDHDRHSKVADRLFEACDRGELTLVLLSPVLAECVFVLESFYKYPRTEVASALRTLIDSPDVEADPLSVHLDALDRYARTKCHFVDCLIAATAANLGLAVATFDSDFKKFGDVRVEVD